MPDTTILLDYMSRKMCGVIEGLRVFPEQMRLNLERTGGLVFSHRVLLALLARGLPRTEAYRIVQDAAMREGEGRFRDLVRASGALSDVELDACFDPADALRHVEGIFARLGLDNCAVVPAGSPVRQGGNVDA